MSYQVYFYFSFLPTAIRGCAEVTTSNVLSCGVTQEKCLLKSVMKSTTHMVQVMGAVDMTGSLIDTPDVKRSESMSYVS